MKKRTFQSHRDIIDSWPQSPDKTTLQSFCADIGVEYGTGQVMRHRGSIPAYRFVDVVQAAQRHGQHEITLELLHALMPDRERVA